MAASAAVDVEAVGVEAVDVEAVDVEAAASETAPTTWRSRGHACTSCCRTARHSDDWTP